VRLGSMHVSWVSILLGALGCADPAQPHSASSSAAPAMSTAAAREQEPEAIAEAWLRLNDAGKFSESWAECAAALKQKLEAGAYEKVLRASRAGGTVQSRTKTSVKLFTRAPGIPDGHYARVSFETVFSPEGTVVETVSLSKEPGDRWRVQGSRTQPASVE
jgi:hypothetical protein